MHKIKNNYLAIQIAVLATFVVLMSFVWQGNKGFSLFDEGFLWYGAQRVILGEVPIRDFMAYDPGRYYWSATLMHLWGDDGIVALRGAVAVFQAMGLFVGLLLIAGSPKKHNLLYLALSAITLIAWMFPRHKLFDIALCLFLIGVLAFLIDKPISRRYFLAGLCVGVVATFGRNHGVYGVAGSLGVILWLHLKSIEASGLIKGFTLWAAGVITGFMPILLMALLVPGFAVSFKDSILYLFELKSTNIPLPIPWPWLVNFNAVPLNVAIRGVLIGLFFIGAVVFGVLSIVWVVWQRLHNKQVSPALVAASFLALPYAHYAYSRADINHLAQGVFPLLVGCLVLLSTQSAKIKWPLAFILGAASLWVMYIFHPGGQCRDSKQCVMVEITGSNLRVDRGTASDVKLLRRLAGQYAPEGQSFIAAPFWPGAYALLKRKSPMWEIYPLLPRSQAFQQTEIERIKMAKPGFALILDQPLDGRDDLRFNNTHPIIDHYIIDNFEALANSPHPSYRIYKLKSVAGS